MNLGDASIRAVSAYIYECAGHSKMRLYHRPQTSEPLGETVGEIPKQRVDELLQMFALAGCYSDEVVRNLVVAPRIELRF